MHELLPHVLVCCCRLAAMTTAGMVTHGPVATSLLWHLAWMAT